jgi:hypothetical protein
VVYNNGGLSLADLNNDGNPDMTLVFGDDYIYTALGQPNGTFGDPRVGVNTFAVNPAGWALVDVNGDGLPDFIDNDAQFTAVFYGNGDGTFSQTNMVYASSHNGTTRSLNAPGSNLVQGDFNNDGHPDFAFVDSGPSAYDRASVYINHGDGIFAAAPAAVPANDPNIDPAVVYGMASFDMNGDGIPDVLVYDQRGIGSANNPYLSGISDGKGGFTFKQAIAPGAGGLYAASVGGVTGDFNGDGLQDVILSSLSGSGSSISDDVAVALSNGDGTFKKPISANMSAVPTTAGFFGIATGDVNGDGKTDIVAVSPYVWNQQTGAEEKPGQITFLLGKGDGTFQPATAISTGLELQDVVIADFNGDGKMDIAVADEGNSPSTAHILIMYGDGTGHFDLSKAVVLATGYDVVGLLTGDLNGDGLTDLVGLTYGTVMDNGRDDASTSGALIFLNSKSGLVLSGEAVQGLGLPAGVLGDFNGDGVPDLFYTGYNLESSDSYGAYLLLGKGDGTFGNSTELLLPPDAGVLSTGDFLKDGALDAVVASSFGTLELLLNQGGTAISVKASSPTITAGENAVISASVLPTMAYRPLPGGTLTYSEKGALVGTADVASGESIFTTSELSVGTHSLTASYSGDANFNPQLNAGTVQIAVTAPPVVAPSFLLQAANTAISIPRGQSGSLTLSVAANSSFNGTISFAVSGPLNGLSAQVAPANVTLTPGQSGAVMLQLNTVEQKSANETNEPGGLWTRAAGGLSLACVVGLVLPFKRKKLRQMLMTLLVLASMAGLAGLSGCGGGSKEAPSGVSKLVVTATPSVKGVAAQAVTLQVTVE